MRTDTKRWIGVLAVVATAALASAVGAQHSGHGAQTAPPGSSATRPPAPITMQELHRSGGVPPGWTFTLPAGDPKAGREAFGRLECNKCHEANPDFPRAQRTSSDVGPELTGMGSHHPAEYFAQSIVDPNAVIVAGPGFVGPDGRSVMPDYRDTVTFTELVDLVAYLRSLDDSAHSHGAATPLRERTMGPYRVRLEYAAPGADNHAHQHGQAAPAKPAGHLMAFVADVETGQPVPYLPVTVVISAGQAAPRTIRLAPMLGGGGFHYGGDVTLPPRTTKLTLNLGAVALKTMGTASARFGKPVTVSFDWSD